MKLFILTLLALVLSFNILSQSNPLLPEDYADYPDPLMIAGNSRVADTEDWNNKRTEILNLFSDHIYGNFPEAPDSMKFFIKEERMLLTGIPCIFKNVNITAFRNGDSASFRTIIYFPVSPKPVPVFVLLNHRKIGSMEAKSAFIKEYWPADKIIQQGFATAMVISGDVSPDDKNEFHKGVISGLFPDELSRANGMKTISAWAWGASRVLDYLETDSLVNTQKAALIGHSRSGKTSLWCGANDERFKLVVSNNSGNSGAALARRDVGEQVEGINNNFPHWFCDNYNQYNNDVKSLPVDQHILLSLIAPRALYIASASEDSWADPRGEFYALNMAVPVYKLFNPEIQYLDFPKDQHTIQSGQIAYHIRDGKHGLTLSDWEKYMNFFKSLE